MANVTSIQVLENGHRNYTVKVTGILDTSDVAITDLIDTTAAGFQTGNRPEGNPTSIQITEIEYDIEDSLSVYLYWDATADQLAAALTGRGELCFNPAMQNNAGAGKTGKLQYQTQGWAASAVLSFVVTVYCHKVYN